MSHQVKYFLTGLLVFTLISALSTLLSLGVMIATVIMFNPPALFTFIQVPFVAAFSAAYLWEVVREKL
jgi:hypothetical protein